MAARDRAFRIEFVHDIAFRPELLEERGATYPLVELLCEALGSLGGVHGANRVRPDRHVAAHQTCEAADDGAGGDITRHDRDHRRTCAQHTQVARAAERILRKTQEGAIPPALLTPVVFA